MKDYENFTKKKIKKFCEEEKLIDISLKTNVFCEEHFDLVQSSIQKQIKNKKLIDKLYTRCTASHFVLFEFLKIVINNVEKVQSKNVKKKSSFSVNRNFFKKRMFNSKFISYERKIFWII